MIYFDNGATTKPYKEVIDTFTKVSTDFFGNPSSLHTLGKEAERLLIQAREQIANLLNVNMKELVFTSGGTEGNNLAIKGAARYYKNRGKHLITSTIEHSATLKAFEQLEEEGFQVTYLKPNKEGILTEEQVREALTNETILVSLIHINNETGSMLPIEQIGKLLSNYPKVLFHVDHVQGIGKVALDFYASHIDLCSMSAHKFHGLKGSGILYVRDGVQLHPLFTGGSQEKGMRPGTENVAGLVAMAKALRMSFQKAEECIETMREINNYLEKACSEIDGVFINSPKTRAPHILNISVLGIKPEVVVQALAEKEIYVSTKSACSSKEMEPSRVLMEMGLGAERASSAIRISLSYESTMGEAEQFIREFTPIVQGIQKVVE